MLIPAESLKYLSSIWCLMRLLYVVLAGDLFAGMTELGSGGRHALGVGQFGTYGLPKRVWCDPVKADRRPCIALLFPEAIGITDRP